MESSMLNEGSSALATVLQAPSAETDLVRVSPIREVHTVQAFAKPRVAMRVVCIPGNVDVAVHVKGRHGERLQQTQLFFFSKERVERDE